MSEEDILEKHPTPWRQVANETILDANNSVVLWGSGHAGYPLHSECLATIVEAVNMYAELEPYIGECRQLLRDSGWLKS